MTLKDQLQAIAAEKTEANSELLQLSQKLYRNAASYWIDQCQPWAVNYQRLFLEEFSARGTDSITAGYLLTLLHTKLQQGVMSVFVIDVPQTPYGDDAKAENNAILSQLRPPFKAEFWGGKSGADIGDDGFLSWDKTDALAPPNSEAVLNSDKDDSNQVWIPLEVGTCSLISFWSHLYKYYGCARWLYGSKYIYGLINTEAQSIALRSR